METIIQLLTDPENQPHQYVNDPEGLSLLLDKSTILTLDLITINVIKECQKVLIEQSRPESRMTDRECVNKLHGILDDRGLVEYLNEIDTHLISEKNV